jgi:hypothetical protein
MMNLFFIIYRKLKIFYERDRTHMSKMVDHNYGPQFLLPIIRPPPPPL